jgi:hypothetical protein
LHVHTCSLSRHPCPPPQPFSLRMGGPQPRLALPYQQFLQRQGQSGRKRMASPVDDDAGATGGKRSKRSPPSPASPAPASRPAGTRSWSPATRTTRNKQGAPVQQPIKAATRRMAAAATLPAPSVGRGKPVVAQQVWGWEGTYGDEAGKRNLLPLTRAQSAVFYCLEHDLPLFYALARHIVPPAPLLSSKLLAPTLSRPPHPSSPHPTFSDSSCPLLA